MRPACTLSGLLQVADWHRVVVLQRWHRAAVPAAQRAQHEGDAVRRRGHRSALPPGRAGRRAVTTVGVMPGISGPK
jgi:hypothetical protein